MSRPSKTRPDASARYKLPDVGPQGVDDLQRPVRLLLDGQPLAAVFVLADLEIGRHAGA